VAVTSPQTRMALRARRSVPSSLDDDALRLAARVRRRQVRVAVGTLAGAGLLLVGLPVVLDLLSVDVRVGGVPVGWIAVAVLPYPVLAVLAFLQLRRAEKAELREPTEPHEPAERAGQAER
jgi:TRAP-type C4-dicarboxylate transport system permease small subunit